MSTHKQRSDESSVISNARCLIGIGEESLNRNESTQINAKEESQVRFLLPPPNRLRGTSVGYSFLFFRRSPRFCRRKSM